MRKDLAVLSELDNVVLKNHIKSDMSYDVINEKHKSD